MTKRLVSIYLMGVVTPLVLALYCGGERIAVTGIKLAAIENGFSLARRDWTFDAVPAHAEPVPVVKVESPAKKVVAKRK